jgi:hypothetical protein
MGPFGRSDRCHFLACLAHRSGLRIVSLPWTPSPMRTSSRRSRRRDHAGRAAHAAQETERRSWSERRPG